MCEHRCHAPFVPPNIADFNLCNLSQCSRKVYKLDQGVEWSDEQCDYVEKCKLYGYCEEHLFWDIYNRFPQKELLEQYYKYISCRCVKQCGHCRLFKEFVKSFIHVSFEQYDKVYPINLSILRDRGETICFNKRYDAGESDWSVVMCDDCSEGKGYEGSGGMRSTGCCEECFYILGSLCRRQGHRLIPFVTSDEGSESEFTFIGYDNDEPGGGSRRVLWTLIDTEYVLSHER
jgi:hypothetical protein